MGQFIYGLFNEATNDQILIWDQRVQVHRAQKEVLDNIKEEKELHCIRWDKQ